MPRKVTHPQNPDVDLLAGAFYADDPHTHWTWMRTYAPAYFDEGNQVWALAGYDEVLTASKQPTLFSNSRSIRPNSPRVSDNMIDKDDPEHMARRMLVSRGFTPKRVRERREHIQALCDDIIDRVCERGSCDFVWDIAAPLPLHLIGDMLGFDRSMFPTLLEWSDDMLRALTSNPSPEQLERTLLAGLGFREYQMGVIADRRSKPMSEDLMSILCHSEIDGEPLHDEALVMEALLLLIGGDETTRHVISGGMHALIEHPDQRARIASGEVPIGTAIEELLRWVTPIKNMNRTAMDDIDIAGQTIAAGDSVLLMYPSANRDETVFDDPFVFDVGRTPNPHLAFGFGTHHCLGFSLAKLELDVMFRTLFDRLPDLELVPGAELPVRPANFVSGFESMKVRFTPTPKRAVVS